MAAFASFLLEIILGAISGSLSAGNALFKPCFALCSQCFLLIVSCRLHSSSSLAAITFIHLYKVERTTGHSHSHSFWRLLIFPQQLLPTAPHVLDWSMSGTRPLAPRALGWKVFDFCHFHTARDMREEQFQNPQLQNQNS